MSTCKAGDSKKGKKAVGKRKASNLMKALRRRKKTGGIAEKFHPRSLQMGGGKVLGIEKRFVVDRMGTIVNMKSGGEEE